MKKVKVGDKLIMEASYMYGTPTAYYVVEVTYVGRKYFTIKNGHKYFIDSLQSKDGRGYRTLYRTKEEVIKLHVYGQARSLLRQRVGINLLRPSSIDDETVMKIVNLFPSVAEELQEIARKKLDTLKDVVL